MTAFNNRVLFRQNVSFGWLKQDDIVNSRCWNQMCLASVHVSV